ncbi:AraC family transcriptional regulator [Tsukamurella sp. 8F]|uniref:AraC family transcriptional regulator n=1 Tax=unclassified Tsukamurella TaxID=2633480 RepID=UPI0023B91C05|nr:MULTISPECIES: AraC family transcriptional regulator [unclassified Tsukamurella]MDF0532436.1 AraC family transcriptional regulator [Tsukamurella sp. 8J]MDF0585202.1 AraC family transcriptional regulator [Tsukamurella sp. 8F]
MSDTTAPTPLVGHERLHGADIPEFQRTVSDLLAPHRLRRRRTAEEFVGDVRAARVADLDLVYLSQGAAVDVQLLEPVDYYDVIVPVIGTSSIAVDTDDASDGTAIGLHNAAILSPGMRANIRMHSDAAHLHIRIGTATMTRRLSSLLGRPVESVPVFDVSLGLSTPAAASWSRLLRNGLDDLDSGVLSHPLSSASWRDHLLTGLLVGHRNSCTEQLDRTAAQPGSSRIIAEVLGFCEANIAARITLADLAEYAGTTERSLQRLFRDQLNSSPMRSLQEMRLSKVHEELRLLDHHAATPSVTDVAWRWGFTHLSRFAAAYRARYGENPSETLRSSVRQRTGDETP